MSSAPVSAKHGILAAHLDRRIRAPSVFWAFAAVILITLLTITVSNRGVVRVVGGVALAGLLIFGLVYRLGRGVAPDPNGTRGIPSSPASAITAIALDSIEVTEL